MSQKKWPSQLPSFSWTVKTFGNCRRPPSGREISVPLLNCSWEPLPFLPPLSLECHEIHLLMGKCNKYQQFLSILTPCLKHPKSQIASLAKNAWLATSHKWQKGIDSPKFSTHRNRAKCTFFRQCLDNFLSIHFRFYLDRTKSYNIQYQPRQTSLEKIVP